jgi:hypothetical protein
VSDCDYWIHQYRAHRDRIGERLIDSIMLVELKTFGAGLPWNQRDTLKLVNEGFRKAFRNASNRLKDVRMVFGSEVRIVHFHGVFLLRLSGNRPDESDAIEWHGRRINVDKLVDILRFAVDPLTLRPRSLRRHHLPSERQSHPELFLVDSTT